MSGTGGALSASMVRTTESVRPLELWTVSLTWWVAATVMCQSTSLARRVDVAVVVEVPVPVGDLEVGIGLGRRRPVEVDVDRRLAAVRRRGGAGDRRVEVLHPPHVAAALVIDVEQVAAGSPHQVDGIRDPARDLLDLGRIGIAVGLGQDRAEAVARVVDEEQGAVVLARVVHRAARCALVEREPGDRRRLVGGTREAGPLRGQGARVRIGVDRGRLTLAVEARTQVGVDIGECLLDHVALVARPAVVRDVGRRAAGHRPLVDLFPGLVADVADVQVVCAGPERHPERVAEAGGDDALRVRVGAREVLHRVVGRRVARVRIDPRDRAVQARRVGLGPNVLRTQHPALGGLLDCRT